ncbi:MAG: thioredoxin family protein, partial [Pseudomonadota bacterium]
VLDKIVRDGRDLQALGIGVAAICSNDPRQYPEDDFGPMTALAKARGFTFPYLHDVDQSVARAYSAVCTPDFLGYDAGLGLQYRGRIDASRGTVAGDLPRELYEAMAQVVETGKGPQEQTPSIGCSIKWASA